jgi:hypothetical protein
LGDFVTSSSGRPASAQNVALVRPAYGSLLFNFPNVAFKNATAFTCRCDLIDFMVRADMNPEGHS